MKNPIIFDEEEERKFQKEMYEKQLEEEIIRRQIREQEEYEERKHFYENGS